MIEICDSTDVCRRVHCGGKFLRLGQAKFYLKGFSYGPFAPNAAGDFLPPRRKMLQDFEHIVKLGANTIRLYQVPSREVLDDIYEQGLRVILDVPWEKHRCFFEDWAAKESARETILNTARSTGGHPAVLAISVVNEVPNDIVRFYGHKPIERFIAELGDSVKQVAPDCLTTYANYPTTEFLQAPGFDFLSFNVYLNDTKRLGAYLDRLQHIAGDLPLVLSEFGLDSQRSGEREQANLLASHVRTVFQHGLAGSIVFSYTDDWFTGGRQVTDWGFGVTNADRSEKPAAAALERAWQNVPFNPAHDLPKVSVVVCAYDAAHTLRGCLESLRHVNYPNYEVILVDDGSKDSTPQFAAEFPEVTYIRQKNMGLSYARNVGARRASGEIVAYTDADCVVDEDWLRCLVEAMKSQGVDAVGGPNITPHADGWAAHCVAASPGNPSHVMLDDCRAEHIPGCNMAFRRDRLMELGGFDAQYRVAGDDVDLCWRLLDQGRSIGYAGGGFVWHHRRETVAAFMKQQIGYGRAEAILNFMHPQRFSPSGRCGWQGRIYGNGAAGLQLVPERIYYGPFGYAPFQVVYRHNEFGMWACVTWLEWHLIALFFLTLAVLYWPLALVSGAMWAATGALATSAAIKASLPKGAPRWCRPLVGALHVLQPIVRSWYRVTYNLRLWRPRLSNRFLRAAPRAKTVSGLARDLYWTSSRGAGRESLLTSTVDLARQHKWLGVFNNSWSPWDVRLVGDIWQTLSVHTVTEELGSNRRFTRARIVAEPSLLNRVTTVAALVWASAALLSGSAIALAAAIGAAGAVLVRNIVTRRNCLRDAVALVARAGRIAQLVPYEAQSVGEPVPMQPIVTKPAPTLESIPALVACRVLEPVGDALASR
jgi:glycosyltransferase involved in cell wall biosynthesis